MVPCGFKVYSTLVVFLLFASNVIAGVTLEKRGSRTSPPSGAAIVRQSGRKSGEFATVQAAVNSLPNDSSSRTIFIYPGTYKGQVTINRSGPLTIYGSTTDVTSYTSNSVTITHSASLGTAGNDIASAASPTVIVNKSNFKLYNVNVKNTFGKASTNGQAVAISASGDKHAYYGVSFTSYQDTVLAQSGHQFYAACYIEGAVDFIFGQYGFALFHKSTIASIGPGTITADGPPKANESLFVINESNVVLSPNAAAGTAGKVFLGRPWTEFARVVFSNSNLGSHINAAGWSQWTTTTPQTGHVLFGEYANTGAGVSGQRASFSTKLTSDAGYTIAGVLGGDYAAWVDHAYV